MPHTQLKTIQTIQNGIDQITTLTGRAIAWLTLAMVIVTFSIVVLRYLFNTGWIAMQESVIYMHAIVFMLGAAVTLKDNAHVRVDIFYQRMNAKQKAMIDLLGTLLFLLPVCLFILWSSWDYVTGSWDIQEASPEAGGLPWIYWLKTCIPAMGILIILQAIANMLGNIITIRSIPASSGTQQHG